MQSHIISFAICHYFTSCKNQGAYHHTSFDLPETTLAFVHVHVFLVLSRGAQRCFSVHGVKPQLPPTQECVERVVRTSTSATSAGPSTTTRRTLSCATRVGSASMPSLTHFLKPGRVLPWTPLRVRRTDRRCVVKKYNPVYFVCCTCYYHASFISQTLSSINSLLERADSVYKLLVKHRNELDQLLTSLAGGVTASRSV